MSDSIDAPPNDSARRSRRERWAEFSRKCYKPGRRDVGNPLAVHVARPLALFVTAIVGPLGVTANQATLAALAVAFLASAVFALGTPGAWVLGALLWNLWYLIDHVDGQLARYHERSSLDGTALDYLMHHVVNLIVPTSIGYGLFAVNDERLWLVVGFAWGLGLLVVGLLNDVRYKAFFQRLKRLDGVLLVAGRRSANDDDEPGARDVDRSDATDRRLVQRASAAIAGAARWASFGKKSARLSRAGARRFVVFVGRTARRMCEVHVLLVGVLLIAIAGWWWGDSTSPAAKIYALLNAGAALSVAALGTARSLRRRAAEDEFTAWFVPPAGSRLVVRNGTWRAEPLAEKMRD